MGIKDLSDPAILKEFTPYSRLIMQEKLSRGDECIDLRTFSAWSTDKQFHPTRNGILMVKAHLIEVMPKILEHLGLKSCNSSLDNV